MSNNENNNNNNEQNINSKDFLIGTLIGGIVGAATALLMAPKSGKELRSDLNDQTVTLRDKGNEFASVAKEKSSSFARTVSDQSSQVANKVRDLREGRRQEPDNFNQSTDTSSEAFNTQESNQTESPLNDIEEAAQNRNTTTNQ